MTKYYGALVGTPHQAVPYRPVDAAYENTKDQVMVRDSIELGNLTVATDTISLGKFGWESVVDPVASDVYFDALGGNSTIAIGDVTTANALAAATDTHTAAGSMKLMKSVDIEKWFQPLWKVLGYADLPTAQKVGAQAEILATLAGDQPNGTVAWQIKGNRRI